MAEMFRYQERITEDLPCVLTDAELLAAGSELARKLAESEGEAASLESIKKQYKGRIERIGAEAQVLGREVREKKQTRQVACDVRWNMVDRIAEVIRTDTGEIVRSMPLTRDQLQGDLFYVPGGREHEDSPSL